MSATWWGFRGATAAPFAREHHSQFDADATTPLITKRDGRWATACGHANTAWPVYASGTLSRRWADDPIANISTRK